MKTRKHDWPGKACQDAKRAMRAWISMACLSLLLQRHPSGNSHTPHGSDLH